MVGGMERRGVEGGEGSAEVGRGEGGQAVPLQALECVR